MLWRRSGTPSDERVEPSRRRPVKMTSVAQQSTAMPLQPAIASRSRDGTLSGPACARSGHRLRQRQSVWRRRKRVEFRRGRHTAIYRPPTGPHSVTRRLDSSLRLPINQPCAPCRLINTPIRQSLRGVNSSSPSHQFPSPSPDRGCPDSTAKPNASFAPHQSSATLQRKQPEEQDGIEGLSFIIQTQPFGPLYVLPSYSLEVTARGYDHLETMGSSRSLFCLLPFSYSVQGEGSSVSSRAQRTISRPELSCAATSAGRVSLARPRADSQTRQGIVISNICAPTYMKAPIISHSARATAFGYCIRVSDAESNPAQTTNCLAMVLRSR